ncbi:hypothetical protein AVEN_18378-1 [Araneus ventricosus]|uniref:Uncharacterized protein n=1 Tax=Araneus ventricosus TaxID=182803 RepID=A0A4Y2TJY0_ARAVE|nr:hypothetical protein AVEN_18378-1 [Araneus ventricosus]
MSGINVEEDLTTGDDLMVFAGVTEEDILSEITDEIENDDEEDDDADPSQSLLTSQKVHLSGNSPNANGENELLSSYSHPRILEFANISSTMDIQFGLLGFQES